VTQQQQAPQPQSSSPAPQPFWQAGTWSFGSHCEQNKRNHMEDRFAAADLSDHAAFGAAHRAGFFAVYDGHSGHEAAEYLESHLQAYVLAAGPEALAADPLAVLSSAVQQAEAEILASYEAGRGSETAGSTLCAVLLVDDKLHVAHVGDSRAVLGRGAEPIQLTRDHKPGCQIEAARIEQVCFFLGGRGVCCTAGQACRR
jgi:serine/threonine protein phosphatase PrpC